MTQSVVQISGFRLPQGSTQVFDGLDSMVPSADEAWEELVDDLPDDPGILSSPGDCVMNQDVIALSFRSVGDWPDSSWFDHEIEMVGIHEVIQPWKKGLLQAINEEFASLDRVVFKDRDPHAVTVLTLWEGCARCDWEGEYEFEYDYLGVLKDLKKALL